MPEKEQVIFYKAHTASFFGIGVEKYHVNIRDLEKVNADVIINSEMLWKNVILDKDFVWQDMRTGEHFVFDKFGVWNKEALEHPLLY